jgi:hypothetical protein
MTLTAVTPSAAKNVFMTYALQLMSSSSVRFVSADGIIAANLESGDSGTSPFREKLSDKP